MIVIVFFLDNVCEVCYILGVIKYDIVEIFEIVYDF